MAAPIKPQDHKVKAAKAKAFTFTVEEVVPATDEAEATTKKVKHTLPPASTGIENISGRFLRDASLGGEEGQLRLGFTMLEQCGADQDVLDALYDMPAGTMLENIRAWMTFGDGDGATVPQS